ncbi:hypothetical protein FA15DRAFT_671863 [Coprinopsis marcescibilis]|uniref:Uncharacterized protein n=1 Tax=Coprinopsis marcescibilis TaxID=230819 RepID=A0A5C3KPQ3_COPMA|nr:hypothetical protein FA15DRAFT_671863 [Coprinopsis marcescibilis]
MSKPIGNPNQASAHELNEIKARPSRIFRVGRTGTTKSQPASTMQTLARLRRAKKSTEAPRKQSCAESPGPGQRLLDSRTLLWYMKQVLGKRERAQAEWKQERKRLKQDHREAEDKLKQEHRKVEDKLKRERSEVENELELKCREVEYKLQEVLQEKLELEIELQAQRRKVKRLVEKRQKQRWPVELERLGLGGTELEKAMGELPGIAQMQENENRELGMQIVEVGVDERNHRRQEYKHETIREEARPGSEPLANASQVFQERVLKFRLQRPPSEASLTQTDGGRSNAFSTFSYQSSRVSSVGPMPRINLSPHVS